MGRPVLKTLAPPKMANLADEEAPKLDQQLIIARIKCFALAIRSNHSQDPERSPVKASIIVSKVREESDRSNFIEGVF